MDFTERFTKAVLCLTLGSESLHDWNIVMRKCTFADADRVLWLKMRPDTPQHYEYVTVENVSGHCGSFLVIRPWTQFYKMEKRADMPLSRCNNVVIRNVSVSCETFFDVGASDKYRLNDFVFERIDCRGGAPGIDKSLIEDCVVKE